MAMFPGSGPTLKRNPLPLAVGLGVFLPPRQVALYQSLLKLILFQLSNLLCRPAYRPAPTTAGVDGGCATAGWRGGMRWVAKIDRAMKTAPSRNGV